MFRQSVSLSNNYEISKRSAKVEGFITIAAGIASYFLIKDAGDPFDSAKLNALYYMSPVIAPLAGLFFLSRKKHKQDTSQTSGTQKVANALTWVILFGVVVFAFWLLYTST